MKRALQPNALLAPLVLLAACGLLAAPARAGKLNLPPEATEGLRQMYNGDPDPAIELFRKIQQQRPDHPLGYLLEANARWWKLYCTACEIKWNMIDAWHRPRLPEDDAYLALADKATQLAEAQLAKNDSAEMRLYAGMGWLLRGRLVGLRDDRRGTARAGVRARAHLLRALQLDPDLADAYTGLGLYNYYADTLSALARVLRFFMGIPGGSKQDGIRQLEVAMNKGELTAVEARFYLAKNLRNYDQKYEPAIAVMRPLVEQYPQNPVFLLLLGDMTAKLDRKEQAAASFHAAEQAPAHDPPCQARVQQLARAALAALSRTHGSN
jgi:tetratricopeptide (TPR) repeat protein